MVLQTSNSSVLLFLISIQMLILLWDKGLFVCSIICRSNLMLPQLYLGVTSGPWKNYWDFCSDYKLKHGKMGFFFSFFLKKSILRVHRNWDGFDLSILHRVKPVMRAEVAKSVSHVAQAAHSHSHVRKPFVGLHQFFMPTVADQLSQRVSSLYSAAVSL